MFLTGFLHSSFVGFDRRVGGANDAERADSSLTLHVHVGETDGALTRAATTHHLTARSAMVSSPEWQKLHEARTAMCSQLVINPRIGQQKVAHHEQSSLQVVHHLGRLHFALALAAKTY